MNRRNRLLSLTLLALVAVLLLQTKPWEGSAYDATRRAVAPMFPLFDRELAAHIEFQTPNASFEMKKAEGGWVLPQRFGHAVSTSRVDSLLSQIEDLKTNDLVSENPKHRSKYQVGEQGTRIVVRTAEGVSLADFVAGRLKSQDFSSPSIQQTFAMAVYVRPTDGDAVYLQEPFQPLSTEASQWLDLGLLSPRSSPAVAIERLGPDSSRLWRFRRETPQGEEGAPEGGPLARWTLDGNPEFVVDAAKPERWIESMATVRARDVAAASPGEEDEYGLRVPETLRVVFEDGSEQVLLLGSLHTDSERYGMSPHSPYVYVLEGYQLDQLLKEIEFFQLAEPQEPAESDLTEE